MHYYSGPPMHYRSGVDRTRCDWKIQNLLIVVQVPENWTDVKGLAMQFRLFIGAIVAAVALALALPFGSVAGITFCQPSPTLDPGCMQAWAIVTSNWGAGILTVLAGAFILAAGRNQIAAEQRRRSEEANYRQGQALAVAASDLREAEQRLATETVPEGMIFSGVSIPDIDAASAVLGIAVRACVREVSEKTSVLKFIHANRMADMRIEDFAHGLPETRFRLALLATILTRCSIMAFSGGGVSNPPYIGQEEALGALDGYVSEPRDLLYLRSLVASRGSNVAAPLGMLLEEEPNPP